MNSPSRDFATHGWSDRNLSFAGTTDSKALSRKRCSYSCSTDFRETSHNKVCSEKRRCNTETPEATVPMTTLFEETWSYWRLDHDCYCNDEALDEFNWVVGDVLLSTFGNMWLIAQHSWGRQIFMDAMFLWIPVTVRCLRTRRRVWIRWCGLLCMWLVK